MHASRDVLAFETAYRIVDLIDKNVIDVYKHGDLSVADRIKGEETYIDSDAD